MKSVASTSQAAPREWPGLLGKIFTPERRRFIKFAIVGGSGVFVNLLVVMLAHPLLLTAMSNPEAAARVAFLLGIVVSIFTNFVVNDYWTWGDREKGGGIRHWGARCRDFYIAASLAAGVQWLIAVAVRGAVHLETGFLFLEADALLNGIATLAGIAIATPINYVVNHFWTFRVRS